MKARQETNDIPIRKCKHRKKYTFNMKTQELVGHLLKTWSRKMQGLCPVVFDGEEGKETPCSVDLDLESSSSPAELSCCNSKKLF